MALAVGKILGGVLGKGGGKSGGGASQKGAGGIQAVVGAGQAIAGMIKQKKADAMMPSEEDAGQRRMMNYFSRQKNALDSGTAGTAQRGALNQMMQSGIKESFKYGAGARGLNAMSQMYQQGITNLNESDRTASLAYAQEEGKVVGDMAQRRLELGMTRYAREQARAAALKTKGNQNLASGMGSLIGGGKSVGTGGGSSSPSTSISAPTASTARKSGIGGGAGLPNPFKSTLISDVMKFKK
jgi:hypothetical protein